MLDGLRRTLRDKLLHVVQEVVDRHHAEHLRAMRQEIAELRQHLTAETNRMIESVRELEHRARRDLPFAGEMRAALDSARFAEEHMTSARQFDSPHVTLKHALSLAPTGGMALEFGVYTGTTLAIIADGRGGDVYGFDSFQGLPTAWRPGFPEGMFGVQGLPEVPGTELVVGLFADVLPGFLADHPGPVDLLHVDCDLYESTVTVLDLVGPRLRPGSIIVFDEYFNYPSWERHEYRAWMEYVERTGVTFEYEGYTVDNEQVIVRVTGTP
ncbi:MAG TPA: class I SAM-dependent methyltransferase [Pseudonocardiaceae bacterium]|nr:class I SAM-dependent methyltransferase [Pseudonocardiaceae bacterium]